jgi:serine/threonine protein kinase/WD40 repeat protein
MAVKSVALLIDSLEDSNLLCPDQLEEVRSSLSGLHGGPRALAEELTSRGWLTPFQAGRVLEGQGRELSIGQYQLMELLGEGGMGRVYKARHTLMDRLVALKVIRQEYVSDGEAVRRFRREIRAVAQLSHPNIVLAYDAAQVDDTHFLVMEYVVGVDLAHLVTRKGPLPLDQACDYVRQAALGLQHAHERGLVHRDVKPSNLLLEARSRSVKLLDLGLARLSAAAGASQSTQTGVLMGTPDYMAPEQAAAPNRVDTRTDIYSLGCTLYHLLTGRPPFAGGTVVEKLIKHREIEPVAIERKRPDVPAALGAVVRRMMAKRPDDRPSTPAEAAEALEPFTRPASVGASPPPPRPPALSTTVGAPGAPDKLPTTDQVIQVGGLSLRVATEPASSLPGQAKAGGATLPSALGPGRPRGRLPLGLAAGLAALLLAWAAWTVVIRLKTGDGTLLVVLSEPDVEVVVDDRSVHVDSRSFGPVTLTPGPHKLLVRRGGEELYPERSFAIWQGKQEVIRAEWTPRPAASAVPAPPPAVADRPEPPKSEPPPGPPAPATEREPAPAPGPDRSAVAAAPAAAPGPPPLDRPGTWEPGPVEGVLPGLIPRPARLPGIGRWQVIFDLPNHRFRGAAFSPDGRRLAIASQDHWVRVYDLKDGRVVRLFTVVDAVLMGLAWAPKGERLALAVEKEIRIFGLDGRRGPVLKGHKRWARAMAWAPDGRRLLSTDGEEIRLWDAVEGRGEPIERPDPTAVNDLAWRPDGLRFAWVDESGRLLCWSLAEGKPRLDVRAHANPCKALCWSPDGKRLVTAGDDKTARVWNASDGKPGPVLAGHDGPVDDVDWSPDGRWIATTGPDDKVRVWSAGDGQMVARLSPRAGGVHWSPAGNRLLTTGQNFPGADVVRTWTVGAPDSEVVDLGAPGAGAGFGGVAWARNGRRFLTGGAEGVRSWDAGTGKPGPLVPDSEDARWLTWSPDGTRFAAVERVGATKSAVKVRDASGVPRRVISDYHPYPTEIAWAPDGRRLAVACFKNGVFLFEADSGQALGHLTGPKQRCESLAWGPRGRLAGAFTEEQTWVWETGGFEPAGRRLGEETGRVVSVGWSRDGRLASGGDGGVRIWPADGGASIAGFPPLPYGIPALAWAPDGRRIALGGGSGSLLVRQIPDGKVLFDPPGHLLPSWGINSIGWDPDGRRLAVASGDRTLRLYDTAGGGRLLWLSVALSGHGVAVFSEAGELLHLDRDVPSLVYAVETAEGVFQALTPAEFRRRHGR